MAQSGSSPASAATEEEVNSPPAKRIKKIEAISGSADAATALDPESDKVPDQLKCPSCKKVPLAEIIQCPNGHPVCWECQLKSKSLECSQCRALMTTRSGEWLRNRMMENVLDAMWFACPYRKNGCREILSRGQVQSHKETCHFEDKYAVRICNYFKKRISCDYVTCTAYPEQAYIHLSSHLDSFSGGNCFRFNVTQSIKGCRVDGLLNRRNGAYFLTIAWSLADDIAFACVRLDKPPPGEVHPATKAVLTLKRQFPRPALKDGNWKRILPVVGVVEAPETVFLEKPAMVSRQFLKQYALQLQQSQETKEDSDDECVYCEGIEEDVVLVKVLVSIS